MLLFKYDWYWNVVLIQSNGVLTQSNINAIFKLNATVIKRLKIFFSIWNVQLSIYLLP